MNLTNKQLQFCKEYLIDLNATQAAIRAGYSKKTARQIAYDNFTKLYIQEEIQRLYNDRSKRTEIDADWVINNLTDLAVRCMTKKEWNPNSANRSLELIGKHFAMFTDKFKMEGIESPLASFRDRIEKEVARLDKLD